MGCPKLDIRSQFRFIDAPEKSHSRERDSYGTRKTPYMAIFRKAGLDQETGLVYYNYRYYSPELGRWLSRDPIGERGGVNLYAIFGNDTINEIDILGLFKIVKINKDYSSTFNLGAVKIAGPKHLYLIHLNECQDCCTLPKKCYNVIPVKITLYIKFSFQISVSVTGTLYYEVVGRRRLH